VGLRCRVITLRLGLLGCVPNDASPQAAAVWWRSLPDLFGANQFVVDTEGHHGYWQNASTSAANIGAIITGHYDQVELIHGAAR